MASVAEPDLDAFRSAPSGKLHPSLVLGTSHLLAYWVQVQPLQQLLAEAVDGGEVLHNDLWHPFRPPMFHRPNQVRSLADQIAKCWDEIKSAVAQDDGGWLTAEVTRLLRLYGHAAERGESVVTSIERPADEQRARRVVIPWSRPYDGNATN